MTVSHKNRVQMSVSGTPGTGTITLGSAASGHQSLAAAYGGNATIPEVTVYDGTAWETFENAAYTHSGTTLSRGTFKDSSTGSALSLTSAAIVDLGPAASFANRLEIAMQAVMPGGRLTLESGVPVSTTDQTAKTTIYYTPYVHDTIPLWDGARWVPTTFAETSEALGTLTSGLPYDVFGFLSSGVLDLEKLAWTNGTTRATAVTLQDGRYCKSGDKTRLLLGTFYTSSTTTTADALLTRYVSNVYNKVSRKLYLIDATSHTYATNTTRYYRNQSTNVVQFMASLGAGVTMGIYANASKECLVAVSSVDVAGTDEAAGWSMYGVTGASAGGTGGAIYVDSVAAGYHYYALAQRAPIGVSGTYYGGTLTGSIEG